MNFIFVFVFKTTLVTYKLDIFLSNSVSPLYAYVVELNIIFKLLELFLHFGETFGFIHRQLSWLCNFVASISSSGHMLVYDFKAGHGCAFSHPVCFFMCNFPSFIPVSCNINS